MKKNIYITVIVGLLLSVYSCNDNFIELYPKDKLSPPTFFRSEAELKSYTNSFYQTFPDANRLFYDAPYYADDDARTSVADEIRGSRVVPNTGGKWTWGQLRSINYYLERSHQCEDERIRAKYDGLARFFRAYFYLTKIIDLGDVPWYDYVLGEYDTEGLTRPRDSRQLVFAKMLEDIDYAIANLEEAKSITRISKWTALALKSRMCLFEGTFRKYHGIEGWEELLDLCASASEELMTKSGYKLYTSTPNNAYQELFVKEEADPSEIILAREYIAGLLDHSVNTYTLSPSWGRPGVTRSFINNYLMKDGSRFTDISNYEKMQFKEECTDRDPRLAQTVRTPGYKRIGATTVSVPDFGSCITGYQYVKFIVAPAYDGGKSTNDMPLFRYAEVLLNFAEAKAEGGTLTQADLDKSIKLLRDRVGMPKLFLDEANTDPCSYLSSQYKNVDKGKNKGVILEIRRERRIELAREGFRWHDLLRWKAGELLERKFYGMYFPGTGSYDLDGNGTIDLEIYSGADPVKVSGRQYLKVGSDIVFDNSASSGQIWVNANIEKKWREDRDYFYPIPTQERTLNPNLTQNPNWIDDLSQ